MSFETSGTRRAAQFVGLFGTASFLTLASTGAFAAAGPGAAPAAAAAEPAEEVLITGTLIGGASAVGVPVTSLGEEAFAETGTINISEMLTQLPEVTVETSQTTTAGGGNAQRLREAILRDISTGAGTETLLMVNGMRVPIQSFSAELIDPSIIAPIAVQRVDVLAEGASATYGSDAVVGVINVILRRGFDGAISQVSYGRSTDIGASEWNLAQLYGRNWGSGGVTLSYSWNHQDEVHGQARPYWTLNFEPIGYENRQLLSTSAPAVVHSGAVVPTAVPYAVNPALAPNVTSLGFAANRSDRNCANCFSVPLGTGWNFGDQPPGPTLTWSQITANPGVQNLHDPAETFDALPAEEHNHAHLTFDQIVANDLFGIFSEVNIFADAFYSNRQGKYYQLPGQSPGTENLQANRTVPTNNPYRPTGAPGNVRVNYNLAFENPPRSNYNDFTGRYAFGIESGLPFDWDARAYYSKTYVENQLRTSIVNANHFLAALGNTIAAAGPGEGAFIKPANIPFLNVFCDPTVFRCNSPETLEWITGFRDYHNWYHVTEWGAQVDGPVFMLPGGPVQVALLGQYVSHDYFREDHQNYNQHSTDHFDFAREPFYVGVYSLTGQVNVPIIGPDNALPFVESFVIEGGYRYDDYSNVGGIWTPKISALWNTGYGLTMRAAWGKAFRAPGVAEVSEYSSQIQPQNTPLSAEALVLGCEAVEELGLPAGVANAGGLDAALNPNCLAGATARPGGITIAGGAGAANPVRGGFALDAETSKNWSAGFNFAPADGFLAGLNIDFTYWNLKIEDILTGKASDLGGTNDPRNIVCTATGPDCTYLVRANPALPITDPANAAFLAVVNDILANPRSTVNPSERDLIQYVEDVAITNVGFRHLQGIDFDGRYDMEVGNWGFFNAGWRFTYRLQDDLPGGSEFDGNSGGRFPWRARLGWSQGLEGFSVTGFLNHIPHSEPNEGGSIPPACFWSMGINPLTDPDGAGPLTGRQYQAGDCFPGSPYTPQEVFSTAHPGLYTWDLNLQYSTGMMPTNSYLQNLNFSLNFRNLLNQEPPVHYRHSSNRGIGAHIESISPLQRFITFQVTKTW